MGVGVGGAIALRVASDGYVVECDDEALRDSIARWAALLHGETPHPTRLVLRTKGPRGPSIERPGFFLQPLDAVDDLMPALEGWIYQRMARPERGVPVLHGAVLARHDRAVICLGPSGAGKSVLALRLCDRGWTYLSDEFAPLDAQGNVVAVPRPVCFDATEIEADLLARIARGRTTWTTTVRTETASRTMIHVAPERAAPSGAAFGVAAIVELEPRAGAPPRMRRFDAAARRALLFGAGAVVAAAARVSDVSDVTE
jgi:hypothetical protein